MKFDNQGRVYWNSLTAQQKFEWDYLDIDPTKPIKTNPKLFCKDHFEEVGKCKKCKSTKQNG